MMKSGPIGLLITRGRRDRLVLRTQALPLAHVPRLQRRGCPKSVGGDGRAPVADNRHPAGSSLGSRFGGFPRASSPFTAPDGPGQVSAAARSTQFAASNPLGPTRHY